MDKQPVLIIIDSGFSKQAIAGAEKLVAVYDMLTGSKVVGEPFIEGGWENEAVQRFADDPKGHGSIVLSRIRAQAPKLPLILIRASGEKGMLRTSWKETGNGGGIAQEGWTEALLWAVELCRSHGFASVSNLSFGGFEHAMDGTGWEAFQLSHVTGAGKPGHIVVAAAGPGDGRAGHAAWRTNKGEGTTVEAFQRRTTDYNLWTDADDWTLEVYKDDRVVFVEEAGAIGPNLWNKRKQLNFSIEGEGLVHFRLTRQEGAYMPARFDCWIKGETGFFHNHVDETFICEPAIFPDVIAVGLRIGHYSPSQEEPGQKPEVLLHGSDQVSFRIPEIVAGIAKMLADDPTLDVVAVKARLPKFPAARR